MQAARHDRLGCAAAAGDGDAAKAVVDSTQEQRLLDVVLTNHSRQWDGAVASAASIGHAQAGTAPKPWFNYPIQYNARATRAGGRGGARCWLSVHAPADASMPRQHAHAHASTSKEQGQELLLAHQKLQDLRRDARWVGRG
eukprot:355943-Chlamydomonas_euryale.AAC.19